ncbi:molybdopterin molybdenumtransferase MoeA [Desulfobacter hydrogenophilus]|uniref:Molybdopterin molybdenumtransferase n=1 Tax=Desulfobacter hydrogenophilus TaxID=2291 RepID=A0A328F715_9BACT|nr:gephyrin-like molybdotransferase Glp [Desulfobacter hydrogenophilus]NDY73917.1 molybdopterin molybdotransferase MoeA [Desulfobacter hydrogenophilus]QBH12079.1 molybdopterin molybdenumtransferase MoeA [Desulfobacter hydrogenophilus]RAM00361.1 molybdopterin molybdenumtransferase MoeA [Desulfobacter hydrogenophilus]
MTSFFKVKSLDEVLGMTQLFSPVGIEELHTRDAFSRVLAKDLISGENLPGFRRSCMDGYAVSAASTFGASESGPAWLTLKGAIAMGDIPDFKLAPGEAARISTGGMLPAGADAVVMVEHTEAVDEQSIEIYKSVAPLQHVIDVTEDFAKGQTVIEKGRLMRPQEIGLAAGLGHTRIRTYQVPKVGIISTGDEVIPVDKTPEPGMVRDINSYSLSALVTQAGGEPVRYGIVKDDPRALKSMCKKALAHTDMVLLSGGSSVGTRDYTVEVLSDLPDTDILVHGISVSPGKPTILAKSGHIPVWGLPGQVVSAMVVFQMVVTAFLHRLRGLSRPVFPVKTSARLSRNLASSQGRRDFVRVVLEQEGHELVARPILGKSGLIRTMVQADGLLEIGEHVEGLEKGSMVDIILLK